MKPGSMLRPSSRRLSSVAFFFTAWLLTAALALGQETGAEPSALPSGIAADPISAPAHSMQPAVESLPELPSKHRFWDRNNIMMFSSVAVFRGLDYASTRNMQARGREEILLPDDVVNNSAGFATLQAAGTATSIGLSYWMHRTGHHKLERWISIVHINVTGFGVARNYALDSKHPGTP